jgi:hypothetical protein
VLHSEWWTDHALLKIDSGRSTPAQKNEISHRNTRFDRPPLPALRTTPWPSTCRIIPLPERQRKRQRTSGSNWQQPSVVEPITNAKKQA